MLVTYCPKVVGVVCLVVLLAAVALAFSPVNALAKAGPEGPLDDGSAGYEYDGPSTALKNDAGYTNDIPIEAQAQPGYIDFVGGSDTINSPEPPVYESITAPVYRDSIPDIVAKEIEYETKQEPKNAVMHTEWSNVTEKTEPPVYETPVNNNACSIMYQSFVTKERFDKPIDTGLDRQLYDYSNFDNNAIDRNMYNY